MSAHRLRTSWTGWRRSRRCGTGFQRAGEAAFSVGERTSAQAGGRPSGNDDGLGDTPGKRGLWSIELVARGHPGQPEDSCVHRPRAPGRWSLLGETPGE